MAIISHVYIIPSQHQISYTILWFYSYIGIFARHSLQLVLYQYEEMSHIYFMISFPCFRYFTGFLTNESLPVYQQLHVDTSLQTTCNRLYLALCLSTFTLKCLIPRISYVTQQTKLPFKRTIWHVKLLIFYRSGAHQV